MQPMVVVFPAPLGPSSPNISPGLATKLTSFTATISPYCLRSCCTSIMLLLQNRMRLARSPEISDERLDCQDEPSSTGFQKCLDQAIQIVILRFRVNRETVFANRIGSNRANRSDSYSIECFVARDCN